LRTVTLLNTGTGNHFNIFRVKLKLIVSRNLLMLSIVNFVNRYRTGNKIINLTMPITEPTSQYAETQNYPPLTHPVIKQMLRGVARSPRSNTGPLCPAMWALWTCAKCICTCTQYRYSYVHTPIIWHSRTLFDSIVDTDPYPCEWSLACMLGSPADEVRCSPGSHSAVVARTQVPGYHCHNPKRQTYYCY
jgi:hypothetical protein